MQVATGIILIMVVVLILSLLFQKNEKVEKEKQIKKAFSGRESLSPQQFYERYFESQGVPLEVVVKIRELLEKHLEADLSRLSAEDDFSKNIQFFWDFDSLADVEIVMALEEEFDIKLTDADARKMCTVRDIVNEIRNKVRAKRGG